MTDEPSDNSFNLLSLYKEIGSLGSRVTAVENTAIEVKSMLTTLTLQISSLQNTISAFLGKTTGSEKTWNHVGTLINVFIAGLTAFLMVHYGK